MATQPIPAAALEHGHRHSLRGRDVSTGGMYVGTTSAGIVWVAYTDAKLKLMSDTFDRREKRRVNISGTQSDVIEDILSLWTSNDDAKHIELRRSFVRGPIVLIESLAEYVEENAEGAGDNAADSINSDAEHHHLFAAVTVEASHLLLAARLRGESPDRKKLRAEVQRRRK